MNRDLTTVLTLRIPREEHQRIEALAREEDRSLSSTARRLISLGFAVHQEARALPAGSYTKALQDQRQEVPC